jgi:hypothetical protein
MKANSKNKLIEINLSEEEALVLLELLHNLNQEEHSNLFKHQSEQRVLWDMEAVLEKEVSIIFNTNYQELLLKARQKVRD